MSQLILYLARHGESVSNFKNIFISRSEDPELTEKGLHQTRSLAESLKGKKIATIFSRSLIHARQTAQIVADKVGLPVTHAKDLIEVGLGRLDGHDICNPAFLSVYINMVTNWERGYPHVSVLEGESLLDVKARLERFLNENNINRKWDGTLLLVGHAILWMSFIWAFCENPPPRINDGFMSKTHLTIISKNGKGYALDYSNLNHMEIANLKRLQ